MSKHTPTRSTLYLGQCPVCKKLWQAQLVVLLHEDKTKFEYIGVIPPPLIQVACSCQIPVVSVSLIYQHTP